MGPFCGEIKQTWGKVGIILEYHTWEKVATVLIQSSGEIKRISSRDLELIKRSPKNKKRLMEQANKINYPHQIYCDMDGVLVDFEAPAIETINAALNDSDHPLSELTEKVRSELGKSFITIEELKTKAAPSVRELMQLLLEDNEEWWASLPWLPEGRKVWDHIKNLRPVPLILTSPMDQNGKQGSIKGKKLWLKRNLRLDTNRRVIFAHDKFNFSFKRGEPAVLIDDYMKNVALFSDHGGYAIRHDNDSGNTIAALEAIKNGITGLERNT
jgi:hypothetical protein